MELLNTRAAQMLAGLFGAGVLAAGIYVWLTFHGYLGWLTIITVTGLDFLFFCWVGVLIVRHAKAPVVVYDKGEKRARVVDGRILEQPVYPASLTSLTYHNAPRIDTQQTPALPAVIDAAPVLPRAESFGALVHEVSANHLILGYGQQGKIAGTLTDLLSTAIIGRPGTGKTTALRFCTAQVLRIGGDAAIMDPHGSIADELSDLLECAEDQHTLERMADMLEQTLDTRLARRRQQTFAPLLLIADEWPVISRLSQRAVEVAGRIVLEGRKVNMYALISGQGLPSEQLGGSLIRDALSSRYVFNTTPAQARMAGLDNETAKALTAQLDTAGPGYAILASATRRPEIVAIPNTTVADLRNLLGELPPLPMKAALSAVPPVEIPKSDPLVAERERIAEAIKAHPSWSNARIFQELGFRNNNKLSLIKALREEGA